MEPLRLIVSPVDCHKDCIEDLKCTSFTISSSSECVLYDKTCTEGSLESGLKYYTAAAHDKPSSFYDKCTHKSIYNNHLSKVDECKTKNTSGDCTTLAHC